MFICFFNQIYVHNFLHKLLKWQLRVYTTGTPFYLQSSARRFSKFTMNQSVQPLLQGF